MRAEVARQVLPTSEEVVEPILGVAAVQRAQEGEQQEEKERTKRLREDFEES